MTFEGMESMDSYIRLNTFFRGNIFGNAKIGEWNEIVLAHQYPINEISHTGCPVTFLVGSVLPRCAQKIFDQLLIIDNNIAAC